MHTREMMNEELKRTFVPALKELGFKGSLPHFRRERGNHIDLVSVQYSKWGGAFVVELSFADSAGTNVVSCCKSKPLKSLRAHDTARRLRLGSDKESPDFWFCYEPSTHRGTVGVPEELAALATRLLQSQAVPWWDAQRA